MLPEPQLVQHRMTWWDAFCLGFGLGLGFIFAEILVLGIAAIVVSVILAAAL
jgi:hypothetical protein